VRENRSHGSVGEPVGNRRLYPDVGAAARLDRPTGRWVSSDVSKIRPPETNIVLVPLFAPPTAQTSCLSPYLGTTAGLGHATGACPGPPGQESGRPNSVSVPISRPPCALSVTPFES